MRSSLITATLQSARPGIRQLQSGIFSVFLFGALSRRVETITKTFTITEAFVRARAPRAQRKFPDVTRRRVWRDGRVNSTSQRSVRGPRPRQARAEGVFALQQETVGCAGLQLTPVSAERLVPYAGNSALARVARDVAESTGGRLTGSRLHMLIT